MPGVRVEALSDAATEWERFVGEAPDATFFHRVGWKTVLERSFGHRCYFLEARREGRTTGVLPLTHLSSRLFGNALISSACCVYGGPVVSDLESLRALDQAATELADALAVDFLEYRLRRPSGRPWKRNADLYATFRRQLDPDPEVNLRAVPRKRRAMVRKAADLGLTSEIDADTRRFYRIYSDSVRNLGTPVYAQSYFRNLLEAFGSDCEILTVARGRQALASVISFYFKDEVLPYYGGGTAEARRFAANDFLYWEVMRRASERGVRVFDFGRSKRGTGAFDYKSIWGFEPEPLHYEYLLLRRSTLPEVNPSNPRYAALIALWKRLPLWAANALGPLVSRGLG